ncbi:MAG: glutamyl-tRNA reductase [Chloroflexi bacterium]|nr:glutamyl-tRNA reductase [Chloroflexota bacterium]
MRIIILGLSHHTAPVDLRDKVAVPSAQLPEALRALRSSLGKGVILSTCNRTEVYTITPSAAAGLQALSAHFAAYHGVPLEELEPHLYAYSQRQAVRHLFRVACGLDSLILGESQILGQVREAYAASSRAGMAGGALSRLFHQALRVGKRARRETAIGKNALSISRAAVELARRHLGDLSQKGVLVIGAGDAGALAARALADAGVTDITVANRTYARAAELAADLNGRAAPLDDLPLLLEQTDIAISATGSPGYVLTPKLVAQARVSSDRPLFLIDIASPKDVDPAVKTFTGVHLYDMDDLEAVAETNRRARQAEAKKVDAIVHQETDAFMAWLRSLGVVPTVAALHQQAEALRARELARALKRLPELASADQSTLEAFSRALVKKLLHTPTATLKAKGDPTLTETAQELFGLG